MFFDLVSVNQIDQLTALLRFYHICCCLSHVCYCCCLFLVTFVVLDCHHCAAMSSPEPGEEDKVEDFLAGLGLHKYIEVLANHEIDFQTLINFTDEDLKRVGIT